MQLALRVLRSTAAWSLLVLTASAPSPSVQERQQSALVATARIVDMYACTESADVEVLDVYLEVTFRNSIGRAIYVSGEIGVMRRSIASDLDAALDGRWEVPSLVADAFAVGAMRPLLRSDLIKIPSGGEWRQQLSASVHVRRREAADEPITVSPGVHFVVLELKMLPLEVKQPVDTTRLNKFGHVWVDPIVVAPVRVDTREADSIGDCADHQVEFEPIVP